MIKKRQKYWNNGEKGYFEYHADKDKFSQYCEELKQSCDKMAAHRISVLTKEITK